jgi:ABC-type nitrate/sulfonate/bicarbonate transport system substrate-binding protein
MAPPPSPKAIVTAAVAAGKIDAHTPGPWEIVRYGDGDSLVIHDSRGDWRVCFLATPGDDGDFEGIKANARLIAAAPELLEAVVAAKRELWDIARGQWNLEDFKNWALVQQIDTALAKVRGQ